MQPLSPTIPCRWFACSPIFSITFPDRSVWSATIFGLFGPTASLGKLKKDLATIRRTTQTSLNQMGHGFYSYVKFPKDIYLDDGLYLVVCCSPARSLTVSGMRDTYDKTIHPNNTKIALIEWYYIMNIIWYHAAIMWVMISSYDPDAKLYRGSACWVITSCQLSWS